MPSLESGPRPDLSGEQFLHQKNPRLHLSQPVEHEIERQGMAGETVSPKPASKIAEWLEVIEQTHTEHKDDSRVMDRLKNYYHENYVIKPENIPESAFLLEQRIAREEGHGTVEITDEFRAQKTQEIIGNQEKSLDKWFNYLTSADADYPMWAKYWAFTSMLQMGAFVKKEESEGDEKKESAQFAKRDKTTASFPMLNPRALAETIGVMRSRLEQGQKSKNERQPVTNTSTKLDDPAFQQLLSTENFSKLYTQFLIEMPEYSTQGLRETRGQWVKYEKGSDPKPLVDSLDGYPLEWCTANIDTAQTQLQGGDFYVYYSIDDAGVANIPRLAIRMKNGKIAENPRGIAPNQNLDPYIGDVLEQKLNSGEFPDKDEFQKKSKDMKMLTVIDEKTKRNEKLDPEDLRFLYELDSKIQGFGYESDPRVAEIRSTRNPKEDAPIVFGCEPEQIAHGPEQVDQNTKAYIGPLFPNIFQQLLGLEYIYTTFPEGKISCDKFQITGKNGPELVAELKSQGVKLYDNMRQSPEFEVARAGETVPTVQLQVRALFSDENNHTYAEILAKANELGLDFLPHEAAADLLLNEKIHPKNGEWYGVFSKPISDQHGYPDVLHMEHSGDGLRLYYDWRRPYDRWDTDSQLMFSVRKLET